MYLFRVTCVYIYIYIYRERERERERERAQVPVGKSYDKARTEQHADYGPEAHATCLRGLKGYIHIVIHNIYI